MPQKRTRNAASNSSSQERVEEEVDEEQSPKVSRLEEFMKHVRQLYDINFFLNIAK